MGLANIIKKILLTGTLALSLGITSCGDSELKKKVEAENFYRDNSIEEMVAVEKDILPAYDGKETVVVYRGKENKGGIIFFRRKENSYESLRQYPIPQINRINRVDVMDRDAILKEGFRYGPNPYEGCAKVKYTVVTSSGREIELVKLYPVHNNQFMGMMDIRE